MPFAQDIERLLRSQTIRKFYGRIPDDHVADASYAPLVFEPDEAYFLITLSEMYLRDRREYWRGFIPVCLVISEFTYHNRHEVVPFFVGDQLLSSIEALVKGQQVEYRNTTVAGPLPYVGDNISLFVGLFRAEVDDFGKALFGFVARMAEAMGTCGFSPYLTIAGVVMNGLPDLLGMKNMEFRFGTRDEFSGGRRGGNTLRQGYLTYANCPDNTLDASRLWVEEGQLFLGDGPGTLQPYRDNDFCLVKVGHVTERDDYRKLPFYSAWENSHAAIWDGQIEKARKELFPRMVRALALSPDLTRSDRFHLLRAFKLDFERAVDTYFASTGATRGPTGVRGATRGPDEQLDARGKIQRAATVGREISKDVQTALLDIAEKWEEIPYPGPSAGRTDLSETQLKMQLQTLKKITGVKKPDPDALADTLVVDAMSFRSR